MKFYKVNDRVVINLEKIQYIEGTYVFFSHEEEVEINRLEMKELKKVLGVE